MITYMCAHCGGTFESEHDEEAREEAARDFPDVPVEEMAVVCDDCYQENM